MVPGPEATPWRLIETGPARGAWNMAVDQALMESVRSGGLPTIRFYRWSPPCLSLGRNQPASGEYDPILLSALGLDVVRRPTGGRAVLHHRELTYSVVVPDHLLGGLQPAYSAINRGLVEGLRGLGVPAELAATSGRPPVPPSLAPCFREPAEGEVVIGARKLVGSAQYREGGVMLQQGSLLLYDDQSLVRTLLRERSPDAGGPAVLAEFLDPLPEWDALTSALASGLTATLGIPLLRRCPLPSEIDQRANELAPGYEDLAWTWRR